MSPVLESPEIRESLVPISVEFYHEMDRPGMLPEAVELLDGFVVKKLSRSPLHASTVRFCLHALQACLKPGLFLIKEDPISISAVNSEPEPDLAVIQGDEEDFRNRHPNTALLVIEVAVNTLQRDLNKAAIYAAAGIAEYWLIEPEARRDSLYEKPSSKGYKDVITYGGETTARSKVIPGFELNLPEFFDS